MEPITHISPETPRAPQSSWKDLLFRFRYLAVILVIAGGLFYLGAVRHQIDILNPFASNNSGNPLPILTPDPDYAMPASDPNRINILIMGIRGLNDPDASDGGPLLTDSIQIFSYDKTTHASSLISIPRDLWVTVHDGVKDKVNTVYEYGFYHSSNSLQFAKDKFSEISGVYINQIVVFDFSSFKEIVDALGGVDVTLAVPFDEPKEWGFDFHLPAGLNHLDGTNALYYARSRYSSTDFDRSKRQQQIMFAIKDKLLQLHFLSDPVRSFSILTLIRSDIKTDIGVWNFSELLDLVNQVKFDQIKKNIISTDNLVDQSTDASTGAYILLPKGGTLGGIKQLFQNSLK